jgi:hypothetical protein
MAATGRPDGFAALKRVPRLAGAVAKACHRHIRRIFARISTCSRVGLSPLAPSFGGGHERLSKWLSSESAT